MNITKSATKAQLFAHIATLENDIIVRGKQLEQLRLELSIARAPRATPAATSDFKARCAAAREMAMRSKCVVRL
jgi:hypothetical protein